MPYLWRFRPETYRFGEVGRRFHQFAQTPVGVSSSITRPPEIRLEFYGPGKVGDGLLPLTSLNMSLTQMVIAFGETLLVFGNVGKQRRNALANVDGGLEYSQGSNR